MDEERTPAVHCATCSRLVTIPEAAGPGDEVDCPFCGAKLRLKEVTLLASEAVDSGD